MVTSASRAEAAELVADGRVRVDGAVVTTRSRRLEVGQRVVADVEDLLVGAGAGVEPDPDVAFTVVYEDDDVIVVDKPAGLVVHPGAGNPTGTLVQGLLARYPELASVGDPSRPGIVHRLDKGTSGLLVVARTPAAYAALVAMLAAHDVDRRYLALVWGAARDAERHDRRARRSFRREPTRMTVSARGKEARTRYQVVSTYLDPVVVSSARVPARDRSHPPDPCPPVGHRPSGRRRHAVRRGPTVASIAAALVCTRPALRFAHPTTSAVMTFESPGAGRPRGRPRARCAS